MNETVLVTGAAGFFGHHLVGYLLDNTDYDVIGLVRSGNVGTLERLHEVLAGRTDSDRVRLVWHDLSSPIPDHVFALIRHCKFVIHAGAETHVDRSIANPVPFVVSNVLGTVHLLQAVRQFDALQRFVQVSTDEVYGPAATGQYFKEGDRYNATNPYAATKAGAEQLVNAFRATYGVPSLTLNLMNLFGERQHREKFIPKTIRYVLDGRPLPIHTVPGTGVPASRTYLHCRAAASALLYLLRDPVSPQKVNVPGYLEVSNLDLARSIAATVGYPLLMYETTTDDARPGHDPRYALDGSVLDSVGWKRPPEYDFWPTLRTVVWWTLHNRRWLMG